MLNRLLVALAIFAALSLAQTIPTTPRSQVYEAALNAERYVVLSLDHDGLAEERLVEALISSPIPVWLWGPERLGKMAELAGKRYLGSSIGSLVVVDDVGYVYYPELDAFVQLPPPIVRLTLERLGIAEEVNQ